MGTEEQGHDTRLRVLRGETSQREFARSIGLTQQNYANYETGRYLLKSDLIIKICETYGCSIEWLLGFGPDTPEGRGRTREVDTECLGTRIRRLRKYKLGISADALGKRLSKPRSGQAVGLWERGKASPDDETIAELAEILGVDVEELCDGAGCEEIPECEGMEAGDEETLLPGSAEASPALSEEETSLVEGWRSMSERQRKVVADLVDVMTSDPTEGLANT